MNRLVARDGDEDALERYVGRVLKLGSVTSSACLSAGFLIAVAGVSPRLASLLLTTGLLLLLATPFARVVVSWIDYVRERDWLFVGLTLIVLLELAASIVAAVYGRKT